jgi:predicted translin family RNA/ssDNA-binding protein
VPLKSLENFIKKYRDIREKTLIVSKEITMNSKRMDKMVKD